MPVTVKPSSHGASSWLGGYRYKQVSSPEKLLHSTLVDGAMQGGSSNNSIPKKIIQNSYTNLKEPDNVFASKNGFVIACMDAYSDHHHLIIRPEDVWFAILTQISIYVNAHAGELRNSFVDHSGQKVLHIEVTPPIPVSEMDHGILAFQMTKLMEGSIKDPSWREWILPAFTTTEKVDQTVASVIFMGTLQKYFTYSWGTRCGLPSVTLLGEQRDWIEIRRRVMTRIPTLGKPPAAWAQRLHPILDGFIDSFAAPTSSKVIRFWQGICSKNMPNGSGSPTYSGWITDFCYWDEKGKCLDGIEIKRSDIPVGFTKVPVTLYDLGVPILAEIVAGSMAIRTARSKERTKAQDDIEREAGSVKTGHIGLDTAQPEVGWFIYTI
jgi:hypothetical protein